MRSVHDRVGTITEILSTSRRRGRPDASAPTVAGAPRLRPPTLADVAERAGVSRQTVSNAVNNPDLLRADTLARVQEAIDELGYCPTAPPATCAPAPPT